MRERYYCEACRVGVEGSNPSMLCSRCGAGLIDLATAEGWDYLAERDQALHDQRQRWMVGFGAIAVSVPAFSLIILRLDHWDSIDDYLRDFRLYIGAYAVVVGLAANVIAKKRWPRDPIIDTSDEERAALLALLDE